ncbi:MULTISPECIES: LysR substrate-binding domain-containing protein [unclassified Undibacterium]|uniref:LysR substrate-binding domain-containing protein n=1 Tax=unclassified Undibacterium TaxID=2630295 RepID=UPI002AC9C3FC|nr:MULTISPECIES: LysR substrate-binding domain-containing protein [unclassified Undibacterium]MEB0138854.1 LysR substrate-binding domain-containing protein [Undibacterium sp. CCC2.1]MEB0172284.1 LysR substrate-binding domain-containing protein [Undibacterium sp. CCC1.1]MEB0176099.1 LysR substrate-binding domain-containing protein [Undibacterium sp. CCC3.4]MEB0215940.1 LysR substrate-binding domain-containing protein [Undibacterium sp. 5I2]WPX44759.1 LysR substrate-binding domain-containing pro
MKPNQLRALVAIAEHGSIHAAARALCLTQPAVTKAIHELEAHLGLSLLNRQSRGVTFTEPGRVVLARARLIVREFERVQEEVGLLKGTSAGRLMIGVTPLAGLTVLPKAFQQFRAVCPDIELNFLEFSADKLDEHLRCGTLDFAVGALPDLRRHTATKNRHLLSLPTSLAVRRGSPLCDCRSLAQLQKAEWLHTEVSSHFELFLAELFQQHGLPPPRRITRCSSQSLFLSLALEADVVIFWSQFSLLLPALREQLSPLQLDTVLPHLGLHLMQREDGLLTPSAEYFIRCIEQVAAEAREAQI